MTNIIKYIAPLLFAALTFVACISDTAEPEVVVERGNVSFSLNASRANTGEYISDASECELIKWYRVVITTTDSRKIVRVIDKTLGVAKELDPIEEIVLGEGTYNVYAFANISYDYLDDLGITTGGTVPNDLSTQRYFVPGYFNSTPDAEGKQQGALVSASEFAAAGQYIPMTSLSPQRIEVTSRINQTFNIEVRRLFAKLEFVFRNNTAHDLQVNGLSIGSMTTNTDGGSILLMNYEESRNDLMIPASVATLSYTFDSGWAINAGGSPVSHSFYVLESRANSVTNAFDLSFNITQKGQAATGDRADYMRYALTDQATMTLIHRNDWIVIPVTFADWQMHLEARNYPPIGGYPQAEINELEGQEFLVVFTGGGDFTIRPYLRKYYDGSDWFSIDDNTKVSGTPTITVEDAQGLFLKAPALTASGEINGRMKAAAGRKACVTISVDVIESTSPLLTKTLTRKIYVTQK